MIRRIFFCALALALLLPLPARAQMDERCFPETGYCISGSIRAYWERNGGLPVFGYPIGNVDTWYRRRCHVSKLCFTRAIGLAERAIFARAQKQHNWALRSRYPLERRLRVAVRVVPVARTLSLPHVAKWPASTTGEV